MKFTVNREKLQKALQRVGSIIGANPMFPVLSNVLLQAEDHFLSLTTTDLEIRISTKIEAAIEVPGSSMVPMRMLASLVGRFVGMDVIFDIDDKNHIELKCGTSHFTLFGLSNMIFPPEDSFEAAREIQIKEAEFKKMVSSIVYAVSLEESRKVLTGVLLSARDSTITLVATDGKRLAIQENTPQLIKGGDGDAIIPLKATQEMRRLLTGDGLLTIRIAQKQCSFVGHDFELTTKLIEGNYPNYRQVIPASFSRSIDVPASLFLSKIETVSILLGLNGYLTLHFENNQLGLQASSAEIGEGSDSLDVSFKGEPFEVCFNWEFLADPLRDCGVENIRMKLNDPLNPMAIEAGEGFLYIIMPVRKKIGEHSHEAERSAESNDD